MSRVLYALMFLIKFERRFERVVMTPLGKSWYIAGKTRALIAHDRILRRGLE